MTETQTPPEAKPPVEAKVENNKTEDRSAKLRDLDALRFVHPGKYGLDEAEIMYKALGNEKNRLKSSDARTILQVITELPYDKDGKEVTVTNEKHFASAIEDMMKSGDMDTRAIGYDIRIAQMQQSRQLMIEKKSQLESVYPRSDAQEALIVQLVSGLADSELTLKSMQKSRLENCRRTETVSIQEPKKDANGKPTSEIVIVQKTENIPVPNSLLAFAEQFTDKNLAEDEIKDIRNNPLGHIHKTLQAAFQEQRAFHRVKDTSGKWVEKTYVYSKDKHGKDTRKEIDARDENGDLKLARLARKALGGDLPIDMSKHLEGAYKTLFTNEWIFSLLKLLALVVGKEAWKKAQQVITTGDISQKKR